MCYFPNKNCYYYECNDDHWAYLQNKLRTSTQNDLIMNKKKQIIV